MSENWPAEWRVEIYVVGASGLRLFGTASVDVFVYRGIWDAFETVSRLARYAQ